MKKRKINVRISIFILFMIVFMFSGMKLIVFYTDLQQSRQKNDELMKAVIQSSRISEHEEEKAFKIDFNQLLSKNEDTVGWIRFNQDKVNNPVVQASDNVYYLKHDFDKTYNQAGTIFMDYRNLSFDDRNVVLFGHAMPDDRMFGSLDDVFEDHFFDKEENGKIQIYCGNEILTYQIFSCYIIEKEEYYITVSFHDDDEFTAFTDTLKKRSYIDFDTTISEHDKILTLSTCSGTMGTSKRAVIHAVRVDNKT